MCEYIAGSERKKVGRKSNGMEAGRAIDGDSIAQGDCAVSYRTLSCKRKLVHHPAQECK